MKQKLMMALILATVVSLPAAAADNGLYVGGSLGQASLDIKDTDIDLGDIDFNDTDTSYKLFAGFRFLSFLAVEAGYVDFGSPSDLVGDDRALDVRFGLNGWQASALGILPIGPVDLYARAGLIAWDADIRAAFEDIVDRDSDSGTDPTFGVGVALRLGSLAVRAEAELFDVDGTDDLYMVSVGATYTF